MHRSQLTVLPPFFDKYINCVNEPTVEKAIEASIDQIEHLDLVHFEAVGDLKYAPEKWTVKDIFQHLIDAERILSYRALRFGRGDSTELPGFDEPLYAQHTNASERSIKDLCEEFLHVKRATQLLYANFPNDAWLRSGSSFGAELSVLALGFIIPGHQLHHMKVIREKYEPLL